MGPSDLLCLVYVQIKRRNLWGPSKGLPQTNESKQMGWLSQVASYTPKNICKGKGPKLLNCASWLGHRGSRMSEHPSTGSSNIFRVMFQFPQNPRCHRLFQYKVWKKNRRVTCSTSPRHMGPPGTTLDIPGVIRLRGSFSMFTSWKVWRGRGISAVGIESALTTWRPLNKAGAFPYPFRSLSAWQSLDCLHSRQKSWLVSLPIFAARDC